MSGKKMMAPNSSVVWIPLAGVANPDALTAVEVLAGTNLSPAIVTGYTLGATDSDVDNSKDITQEGDVDTPTFGNYEGALTFFRSDLVNITGAYDIAYNLFKVGRSEGYLVHRIGIKNSTAFAATQDVSVYSFTADYPRDIEEDGGAPIKFEVPFIPLGFMKLNTKLV